MDASTSYGGQFESLSLSNVSRGMPHGAVSTPQLDPVASAVVGPQQHQLPDKTVKPSCITAAIVVSYISIAVTLALGIGGLVVVVGGDLSASMLVFALEQLLDCITSLLVIWRFDGFTSPSSKVGSIGKSTEVSSATVRRDKRAGVLISFIFLVIGVIVLAESIDHSIKGEGPSQSDGAVIVASISVAVFTILGISKLLISNATVSTSLRKDAWLTFMSTVLSAGVLASIYAYRANKSLWWIDLLIALPIAVYMIVYASWSLSHHSFWKKSFWRDENPYASQV